MSADRKGMDGALGIGDATRWICTRCKQTTDDPGEALRHECADKKAERVLLAFLREPETQEAVRYAMRIVTIRESYGPIFDRLRDLLSRIAALDG